ncbi:MAG TPA: hypothetical protein VNQ73_15435 [Ilumatobacter sp.]|nr:hypothetical protein [Ilumatobacter sp.]
MDFTVGGERISLTYEQVERAMKGIVPEPYQKYVVELLDTVYPPKQVFATVTGRDRQTFTTLEAQRVLKRLGFVCREAGTPSRPNASASVDAASITERIEATLTSLQLAVAELSRRVTALEAASSVPLA